jgi:hypothetical protein
MVTGKTNIREKSGPLSIGFKVSARMPSVTRFSYDRSSVCVSSYFFAFIREFNILCFDSILNGGYVLFKAVLISLVLCILYKKPIDNALIGVQETIQATKDITNGDITNGAIVIAGAISKKIPGGKQLVDKISSIVDKKKKVRTSKVGDCINLKRFFVRFHIVF